MQKKDDKWIYYCDEEKEFNLEKQKTKDIGKGITYVFCEDGEEYALYSIEFKDDKWDMESAEKWIDEHKDQFNKKKTTKSIAGVEIFAVGEWNGDAYTKEDLEQMVVAFQENKETLRPYIKLGHDEDQKLLQKDGLNAAGWISDLRLVGDKLVADIKDIPSKVYELIINGAYKKVSSEIYYNVKLGDKIYRRFLSAVSLLGTDMPAVSSLDDILGLYSFASRNNFMNNEGCEIKIFTFANKEERDMPTEKEIQLEAELKALRTQKEELENEKKTFSQKESESLKIKEQMEAELKLFKLQAEEAEKKQKEAELDKLIDSIPKMSPAMKPFAKAILGEDKKTYSIESKELTKHDLFKEMLALYAKALDVNLEESSEEGEHADDGVAAKIEKYMTENKVTYATAYKAVMREVQN